MQIVRTPGSARAIARTLARPVGFVPTMGALHVGHLALVDRARRENASVVASVFVNPLQFGPNEDYARYPRDFERDAALLEEHGDDVLFAPAAERMYGREFATSIDTGPVAERFEGAARPGHFAGVATVVAKLLHAVEPTALYLGQKDAQQIAVLRRMIADLDFPVSPIVCATVREADGLALSSRNAYLAPEQRAAAPSLYRALRAVAERLMQPRADLAAALAAGEALLAAPLTWEYLAVCDPVTFAPLERAARPALVLGVARAGAVRLLDNVTVAGADGHHPLLTPERPRARAVRM